MRCIERMHFHTTNFQARAPAFEILSCFDRRAARRGMSDVGGSLLFHCCAYGTVRVDNISINCGYAKGMRRSLIKEVIRFCTLQLITPNGAEDVQASTNYEVREVEACNAGVAWPRGPRTDEGRDERESARPCSRSSDPRAATTHR